MNNNTILVTGAKGQLGRTLQHHWGDSGLVRNSELIFYDSEKLDMTLVRLVEQELNHIKPRTILNTAAYTSVDHAETDRDAAFAINASAVSTLAGWAASNDCFVVHISTDFVFDGSKSVPYLPADHTSPLSVYGSSKLAGEAALQSQLPDRHAIIRTSWLYSEYGKNFLQTMLRLMKEQDELEVVADQVGSPTSTHSLGVLLLAILDQGIKPGIYHWTDGASISWYEFAQAIQQEAIDQGLLGRKIPIKPLTTKEYPAVAVRPAYSVLDRSKVLNNIGIQATNWQQELKLVIKQVASRIEG
ncbi:MAG: dTDP-4-dehydrorhamnose reductase [Pseudomonadota bacterium]|nr:dTDP-4-dehydrorhamnose reductase [Pseudomonadota bacterium]